MEPLTLAATAVAFLSPHLAKAGEKAVEEVGKKLPTAVGQMWQAIMARFKDKPAAAEAVKDVVAHPQDKDNQAALHVEKRERSLAEAVAVLVEKIHQSFIDRDEALNTCIRHALAIEDAFGFAILTRVKQG